ncbi:MAG TPA: sulfatase-like hydrolase/transferase [Chryseolinea sp.]|nr:sulfatase-like hydrolase/transferase [Chryseolinea sp.]
MDYQTIDYRPVMKQRLILLLSGFVAWTIFFLVARALFLVYHANLASDLSISDIFLVFLLGIRMDFSMAGYFSLLPGLVLGLFYFASGKSLWRFWLVYHATILFAACFIIVLDFELYKHWGFRLDATPIMYMGKEAAQSGDLGKSIFLIILCLVIYTAALFGFYRYFKPRVEMLQPSTWQTLPVLILVTACFILPIRGSFGVAPMNSGFVYFHNKNVFANHAAVNVVWNFAYAVQKMNRLKYSDNYFDKNKTEQYFQQLFPTPDSTAHLLRVEKPNVIIIMLESYSSGLIERLGGEPGVTPNFNALIKEGILFDHFYSSGDRTDKGIVSVLNGYPSQPVTSMVKEPKKTQTLPYLNKVFKAHGYHTEFTYGYNINYANFNSYLMHGEFDHVTHSKDFPQELNTSKWGVHDQYVFQKFQEELSAVEEPFFKIMMTQSSHEPFDVPMETVIQGSDEIHRFMNSAFYTDKCFGEFIEKAKKSKWWDNTLIVVTADHGHIYPKNPGVSNPGKFKIPMLWLGGAIAKKDTVIHTVGGHPDIPNTILGQLGQHDDSFIFSHDILSKNYKPFAVFVYNNGFGVVTSGGVVVFDNIANRVIQEEGAHSTEDLDEGKAYMQKLYWDFNSR